MGVIHFFDEKADVINLPLITCACITHQKPKLLMRAMQCFEEQSYPNKQLLIVFEEADKITCDFILMKKLTPDIKIIRIDKKDKKKTLGELRNIAVVNADGEFICQWDDDDWYHSDRLMLQYQVIIAKGKPGSLLHRWIVYDGIERKAYLSHKRLWEGSVMCRKELFAQYPYAHVVMGEDTDFIELNYHRENLTLVEDIPHLYIYVYHGKNTWDYEHFKEIIDCCKELPKVFSAQVSKILNLDISVVTGSQQLNKAMETYFSRVDTNAEFIGY